MTQILAQMPSAEALYLKAATTVFRRPKGRPSLPTPAVRVENVEVDARHLAAYREVCGFPDSDILPITFPHVMAGALHLQLMTRAEFPLPMLGLVHIRNRIEQTRGLRADERFSVNARIGDARDVRQGLEFDLLTEFEADGEVVWQEASTILFRVPGPKTPGGRPPAGVATPLSEYASFDAPADIGRRYASVGKDYNPIHLTPLSAKLFGFKRHIAHGMWSLAHCAALLEGTLGGAVPRQLEVQFKQPLFLPGRVALKFCKDVSGTEYALLSRTSNKVHLSGTLR